MKTQLLFYGVGFYAQGGALVPVPVGSLGMLAAGTWKSGLEGVFLVQGNVSILEVVILI